MFRSCVGFGQTGRDGIASWFAESAGRADWVKCHGRRTLAGIGQTEAATADSVDAIGVVAAVEACDDEKGAAAVAVETDGAAAVVAAGVAVAVETDAAGIAVAM